MSLYFKKNMKLPLISSFLVNLSSLQEKLEVAPDFKFFLVNLSL